jgi:hypothetical protein
MSQCTPSTTIIKIKFLKKKIINAVENLGETEPLYTVDGVYISAATMEISIAVSQKNKNRTRAGGLAQVVQWVLNKFKALNSSPSTPPPTKNNRTAL